MRHVTGILPGGQVCSKSNQSLQVLYRLSTVQISFESVDKFLSRLTNYRIDFVSITASVVGENQQKDLDTFHSAASLQNYSSVHC